MFHNYLRPWDSLLPARGLFLTISLIRKETKRKEKRFGVLLNIPMGIVAGEAECETFNTCKTLDYNACDISRERWV
jgi:hypothetical protein